MTADYILTLEGCDDNTEIKCSLYPTEVKLLRGLADKFNATSRNQCMPRMKVEALEDWEKWYGQWEEEEDR